MGHGPRALFAGGIGLEKAHCWRRSQGLDKAGWPHKCWKWSQYKGAAAVRRQNFEHVEGAGHV